MATIGPVALKVELVQNQAKVDVSYAIAFDSYDQNSNQAYVEVVRLVGDDTNVGDPLTAGTDDILGFVTPLFLRTTRSDGQATLARQFTKTFPKATLDEDRGDIPNPDELYARVTLTPVAPATVTAQSNMVAMEI